VISTPAGSTIGLKERLCAHTGTTSIAGTLGCIMLAPAAAAYAVLPVGVEIISPSPCQVTIDSIRRGVATR